MIGAKRLVVIVFAAGTLAAQDPGTLLMGLASGTSANPASWPMPMLMTHFGNWNTMFMGVAFRVRYPAIGTARRRQALLHELVHGLGRASRRREGAFEARADAQPGAGHNHGSPLSAAVPDRRDRVRRAADDAQHPHNFIMAPGIPLRVPARRRHHAGRCISRRWATRRWARSRIRTARRPWNCPKRPSRITGRIPRTSPTTWSRWGSRTRRSSWKPAASMAPSRARIAGSCRPARSIRGPRACGFSRRRTGRRRFRSAGSLIPKRWSRATRCARPRRSQYTKPMPGGSWSSSLIWGRNHNTATLRNLNSYLAESVLPIRRRNFITGRFELVDKDELFSDQPELEQAARCALRQHFPDRRLHHRLHARHRSVSARRDRRRRELHRLLAAGRDQAILRQSSGGRKCFCSFPAQGGFVVVFQPSNSPSRG